MYPDNAPEMICLPLLLCAILMKDCVGTSFAALSCFGGVRHFEQSYALH